MTLLAKLDNYCIISQPVSEDVCPLKIKHGLKDIHKFKNHYSISFTSTTCIMHIMCTCIIFHSLSDFFSDLYYIAHYVTKREGAIVSLPDTFRSIKNTFGRHHLMTIWSYNLICNLFVL